MAEIKWIGLNKLQAKLQKNANAVAVKRIVQANAIELTKNMTAKAPVDTGAMARSIKMELSNGGLHAEIGPTTEYAPYVEYGTRYMNAQPFVRPALLVQSVKFKNDLNKLK